MHVHSLLTSSDTSEDESESLNDSKSSSYLVEIFSLHKAKIFTSVDNHSHSLHTQRRKLISNLPGALIRIFSPLLVWMSSDSAIQSLRRFFSGALFARYRWCDSCCSTNSVFLWWLWFAVCSLFICPAAALAPFRYSAKPCSLRSNSICLRPFVFSRFNNLGNERHIAI